MPPKKKTTETKKITTSKKPKATVKKTKTTSAPKSVKVTRTRKAPAVKKEHIVDLRDTIPAAATEDIFAHEADYSEPYQESAMFDISDNLETEEPARWSLSMYQRIALTFIILSLFSLGAVLYITFVRLDITIRPRAKTVEAKTNFTVYDRPETYNMPPGGVLGLVRSMEVEGRATVPATGKQVTGAEVSGTVTIINKYTKDQPLVATTRLLTPDNQLLRLTEGVVVPAGGEVQALVYAEASDPSFTLTDTHLTIPGLWAGLQDQIYAEAKAGSVGYKEKVQYIISQSDSDEAIRQGKIVLLEKARQQIEDTYAAYDERLYQLDEASLEITSDNKVGDVAENITVELKGSVTVVAFNKESLSGILGTALSSVGSSADPLEDSAPIFTIDSADTTDNVAQIDSQIHTTSNITRGAEIVNPAKLKGLKRNQVEEYIRSLPEVESFKLNFTPSFLPWAPYNIDNIKVKLEN